MRPRYPAGAQVVRLLPTLGFGLLSEVTDHGPGAGGPDDALLSGEESCAAFVVASLKLEVLEFHGDGFFRRKPKRGKRRDESVEDPQERARFCGLTFWAR